MCVLITQGEGSIGEPRRAVVTSSWDDGHPLDLRVADLLARCGVKGTYYVPGSGTPGEVYNVSGGVEITNREIIVTILSCLDLDDSRVRYVADRPGHDRRYAVEATKITRETG